MSSISTSCRLWGQGDDGPAGTTLLGLGGGSRRCGQIAPHGDLDVAAQRVGDRAEIGRPPDHAARDRPPRSPGTCARTVSSTVVIRGAPSTSSSVQAALHGHAVRRRLVLAEHKRERHREAAGMAAAMSSSGLVLPSAARSATPTSPRSCSSAPLPLVSVPAPRASGPVPDDLGFTQCYGHGSPSCFGNTHAKKRADTGTSKVLTTLPIWGPAPDPSPRGAPFAVDRADNTSHASTKHNEPGRRPTTGRSPRGSNWQRAACGTGAQPR